MHTSEQIKSPPGLDSWMTNTHLDSVEGCESEIVALSANDTATGARRLRARGRRTTFRILRSTGRIVAGDYRNDALGSKINCAGLGSLPNGGNLDRLPRFHVSRTGNENRNHERPYAF